MKCGCDNGWVFWEEDGREVKDPCYHCGNTGIIDDTTYFHDQLGAVAYVLAHMEECDFRKACRDEEHGMDYDLCAAENMISTYDYFCLRVENRMNAIMDKLLELPLESQELLIAWNNAPRETILPISPTVEVIVDHHYSWDPPKEVDIDYGDIPF